MFGMWANWQDLPTWVKAAAITASMSSQLKMISENDSENDDGRPVTTGLYAMGDEAFFMVTDQAKPNPALVYFMQGQKIRGAIVWGRTWPY